MARPRRKLAKFRPLRDRRLVLACAEPERLIRGGLHLAGRFHRSSHRTLELNLRMRATRVPIGDPCALDLPITRGNSGFGLGDQTFVAVVEPLVPDRKFATVTGDPAAVVVVLGDAGKSDGADAARQLETRFDRGAFQPACGSRHLAQEWLWNGSARIRVVGSELHTGLHTVAIVGPAARWWVAVDHIEAASD